MIRDFVLPVVSAVLLLTGCSSESSSTLPSETVPKAQTQHRAAVVANAVLVAIHDGDAKTIRSFFNETNRTNIGEEQFIELVEVAQEIAGTTKEISELRHGDREGIIVAKIRTAADKVHVLVLELEQGEYRLEDINTPAIAEYDKLKILQ